MYEGKKPLNQPGVVINTEWEALGNSGSLEIVRTTYDHQIDKNSLNPGKQIYEKLISGMYLGELTRILILDAIEKGIINLPMNIFCKKGILETRHLSAIEDDEQMNFQKMNGVLKELGISTEDMSYFDRGTLR